MRGFQNDRGGTPFVRQQVLGLDTVYFTFHVVGPCHRGMARPQVADRGAASDKEGSCE